MLGAEGPYALGVSYAGVSLSDPSKRVSDSVKQVVDPVYISIDSNRTCRDSLLATLRSIHEADILHGDIQLRNLCVTPSGEAFVVNFGHATENHSQKKALEIKYLACSLGMNLPEERCGDTPA